MFVGLVDRYGFYTLVRDLAGNVESSSKSAEASTEIVGPPSVGSVAAIPTVIPIGTPTPITVTAKISRSVRDTKRRQFTSPEFYRFIIGGGRHAR